jgi:hypothetical protein
MLDFHQRHGRDVEVVWRAELPSFWSMRSARVEHSKDFGWVLVVRLVHEEAKRLLIRHAWPEHVAGWPESVLGQALGKHGTESPSADLLAP